MDDLAERVRRLEDERSILDTLYAYGHSLDYGERDEWIDCWAENGVLHWPHQSFRGREEIASAFDGHSHAPEAYHKHLLIEPRVRLEGDRARVDSYFSRVDGTPEGPRVRSIGRYRDIVVRCPDGRWRIEERRTERESLVPGSPVT
jgi:ketosteroid isomerase-like protein